MIEQREDARRRVCLGGMIETAAFLPEIPCTVRDVSLAGVRIRVASGAILPERVVLRVPIRGECRLGRVVWRMEEMVGLHFEPDAPGDVADIHRQLRAEREETVRLRTALVAQAGSVAH
ncbi:PilZ domain-containing protein [Methylobacterium persicinum]|uniref:PilZ domain-containing protein n=1 Tax=Methylobacterium persicinum TaxID=374426 RepID=A0ABU0HIG3_9HYPH|nr:PilZ domain-containing protein [Methylobacterium persicinum]MDQ0442113.1 hypothetical protein [Methylobacterium persicinum]GJE38788.1 hypothetical protein KHHGKMAE_2863 [Methylobacterium persicinum]